LIIDSIDNAGMYSILGSRLEAGIDFLRQADIPSLGLGRHDILGDDCFALVSEYETKPLEAGVWEAHRKYIDIQCLTSGREKIGYANIDSLSLLQEYDADKDLLLLSGSGDFFTLTPGVIAIFAPQDAHMPGITVCGNPERVRKVVVKVKV
jgi:YhcH/YjgK/YiaL family protein